MYMYIGHAEAFLQSQKQCMYVSYLISEYQYSGYKSSFQLGNSLWPFSMYPTLPPDTSSVQVNEQNICC